MQAAASLARSRAPEVLVLLLLLLLQGPFGRIIHPTAFVASARFLSCGTKVHNAHCALRFLSIAEMPSCKPFAM